MAEEVRVRLSAEGVNALVQEFKKVQEGLKKTDKTAKDASTSMDKLKTSAAGVTGAMRLLGVVAGVRVFANMAKDAIALAANLGALRQKTGITVDTLSTLSYASRTASLSQEQLSTAMVNFSKVMAGYDTNAKGVREATQNLFGDRNALQGLNQDQRFLKIADALSKLEPGARRAGLAMQFFGKSGAELLPKRLMKTCGKRS